MVFFDDQKVRSELFKIGESLDEVHAKNDFEDKRNNFLGLLINSFRTNGSEWDKRAELSIINLRDEFSNVLSKQSTSLDDIELLYYYSFEFLLERYLDDNKKPEGYIVEIKEFTIKNIDEFSIEISRKLSYAIKTMPLDMFKRATRGFDINSLDGIKKLYADNEELRKSWESDFANNLKKIKEIKESLEEQKNAYNFVGLYNGFDQLSSMKLKEKRNHLGLMWLLGVLSSAPIIWEIYNLTYKITPLPIENILLSIIPMFSLLFVLLYYFKISLHNYKSVNTQLSQIELRKSLCRFIQNYAQYSKEIKEQNISSLDKFESIIFSNILMKEEALPSTFDGIESLAKLIKSAKG